MDTVQPLSLSWVVCLEVAFIPAHLSPSCNVLHAAFTYDANNALIKKEDAASSQVVAQAGATAICRLQHLDLTNNSLGSLPPVMGNMLPHLRHLLLEGNCFRAIRRQVLDRGTQGVLEYLRDRIPV